MGTHPAPAHDHPGFGSVALRSRHRHPPRRLAYAVSTCAFGRTSAIRIVHVGRAKPLAVTAGRFRDTAPAWDPSGRYVAFLSSRVLRATEDE